MDSVDLNSPDVLGANGILGVAATPQDCGSACANINRARRVLFLP